MVPDTAAGMPMSHQSDLVIHPAFLDQLIQMYWPILGAGSSSLSTLYMPSSFGRLSISAAVTSLAKNPGEMLRAYCSGNPSRNKPRPTRMAMFATAPSNDKEAVISIDELTISPLPNEAQTLSSNTYKKLCYKLQREPILERTCPSPDISSKEIIIIHKDTLNVGSIVSSLSNAVEESVGIKPTIDTLDDADPKGKICICLVELDAPLLSNLSAKKFHELQHMLTTVEGIIWVVRGAYEQSDSPESNLVSGLSRAIRSETLLKFVTVDFDSKVKLSNEATAKAIVEILRTTFGNLSAAECEMEFMERAGKLYTPRILDDAELNKPMKLTISLPGTLDTLHFVDDHMAGTTLAPDDIKIEIKASSMNFKDIMIAMGELSSDYLGIECTGIVKAVGSNIAELAVGDRVCAISEGAYATYTRNKATSAFKIPDNMSYEEASTIPVVYCTAYYSLVDLGRLCQNETVLIHAAAGGVGQAAIVLSKMIGAEIFATVGSAEKKEFLQNHYGIPEDHIFYSRDTSFAKAIKRATNSRGVDMVINSLAGDALRETWECLAHFGRFVEIGKRDINGNSRLEMARFEHNATFASVDLTVIAVERPQPISPITVFPISDVEKAFRNLQSGKVHGKIVIVAGPDDQVKAIPPRTSSILLRNDATYIIIGGTGGLGRSMARWMINKGARHIVLVSRTGNASGEVVKLIQELSSAGVNIAVHRCNLSMKDDVENLISGLSYMPPVRGVIPAAMVLHDVLFEKMSFEDYESVIMPKVAGAWNFHHALLETRLDFFITISSAAGIVGNRGQAAYAAANTFLDAFVQHRIHLGLSAATIDLTAVSDVGYLAENLDRKVAAAENLGSETISESEVLALLAAAITGRMAISCNNHCITGMRISSPQSPFWATDPKFKHLLAAASASASGTKTTEADPTISLSAALKGAHTPTDAEEIIIKALLDKIATVLMLEREEMDPKKSISSYGLDSLVAIEIRNLITREFEASLQVLELLTSGSILALAKIIYGKSKLVLREVEVRGEAVQEVED